MISFAVFGAPIPQSRPRFTRQGHAYESGKSREYKQRVSNAARLAMVDREPLQGALWCSLVFYMPLAKSLSQKRRMELQGEFVVKKPDTDNLTKAVLDGMKGIVFEDDAQVARIIAEKRFGETPRVEVMIDKV